MAEDAPSDVPASTVRDVPLREFLCNLAKDKGLSSNIVNDDARTKWQSPEDPVSRQSSGESSFSNRWDSGGISPSTQQRAHRSEVPPHLPPPPPAGGGKHSKSNGSSRSDEVLLNSSKRALQNARRHRLSLPHLPKQSPSTKQNQSWEGEDEEQAQELRMVPGRRGSYDGTSRQNTTALVPPRRSGVLRKLDAALLDIPSKTEKKSQAGRKPVLLRMKHGSVGAEMDMSRLAHLVPKPMKGLGGRRHSASRWEEFSQSERLGRMHTNPPNCRRALSPTREVDVEPVQAIEAQVDPHHHESNVRHRRSKNQES